MNHYINSKLKSVRKKASYACSYFAITPLLLAFGLFFLAIYVDELNYSQYLKSEKVAVKQRLQTTSAKLVSLISSNVQAIYAMAAAIKAEPNMNQVKFGQLSQYLLNDSNQLKIIAVAPDLMLTLTHPFEKNKQTIGFDYRSDPQILLGALTAKNTQSLVLTGPINSIQGSKGFLALMPIYLSDKQSKEAFWGIVSGVIDSEAVLKRSGLYDSNLDLDMAIWGLNKHNKSNRIVFGAHRTSLKDAVSHIVELPSGNWKIFALPKSGWPTQSPNKNILRITLVIISFFILVPLLSATWLNKKRKAETNRLINLFKLSPIGIVSTDFNTGDFLECNPSFLQRTGFTLDELKAKSFRELTPLEYYDQDTKNIKEVYKTGRYGPYEKKVLTKDNKTYPAVLNGMLSHETNEKTNIWSFIMDITESKKAEQEIALQKVQLELVIENTSVGIWDWNIKTSELILNERWAKIIGYTLEELSPLSIETWMAHAVDEDLKESSRLLKKCWDNPGSDYIFEARIRHKDGSIVWVLDSGRVIEWDIDGSPIRMVGTHIDITDRKINEKKLIIALEHANSAAEAKSHFLATMSHEIRTPMNGILGMLELLNLSGLSTEQARKISIAQSSASSLLTIINDILDFSKMDAGKLKFECIIFNLRELIDNCAESLALQAQEKSIELIIDNTGIESAQVMGDPNRIRQILMNLLGNAIKFTHKGEVSITSLLVLNKGHLEFSCAIRDTGIGVSFSKLGSLFNTFTQADTSTTREYGGTGLGLAISKKLALLMNGNIIASSEKGLGSEFKMLLPLKSSNLKSTTKPKSNISNRQFLIIDKNISNQNLLKKQIEVWQGTVHLGKDIASSKKIIIDNKIDYLLIDSQNLNGDYIKESKEIRDCCKDPLMTLILMAPMQLGITEEIKIAFDFVIQKPISTFDLFYFIDGNFGEADNLIRNSLSTTVSAFPDKPLWPRDSHILLVEDILFNQEVATMMLEEIGLTADIANNGKHALRKLQADASYTLVLMDCQMPEMDGFDVTRAIRNGECGEHYKKINIIALTANAMKEDEGKCKAAGMDDYLSKPIDIVLFERKLKQYLV
jgi:two-component system sensor histidine kinase/response regulator